MAKARSGIDESIKRWKEKVGKLESGKAKRDELAALKKQYTELRKPRKSK